MVKRYKDSENDFVQENDNGDYVDYDDYKYILSHSRFLQRQIDEMLIIGKIETPGLDNIIKNHEVLFNNNE